MTGVHVPLALSESRHDSHCPSHFTLQHTESAQTAELHSRASAHAAPFESFAAQTPLPVQYAAGSQSASVVQAVLHAEAPQT